MIPPVLSPVSTTALRSGARTALGLEPTPAHPPEEVLRARYRMRHVLLTNSGTSALVLALKALTRPGDTVVFPAYACIDLTTAAIGADLRVRLYDLDPATLSPDLDSVRAALSRGAEAVVVAHLFGYPADVPAVRRIAEEYSVPVIEDAAQAAGGLLAGERLGALADVSVLSFGRGKGMTAGSGGALMTRTAALAAKTTAFGEQLGRRDVGGRELVALAAQGSLSHPNLYRLPASIPALKLGEMVYHRPTAPKPMTATAAALLASALESDAIEVEMRRARAGIFLARAGSYQAATPVRPIQGGEPGYLRLAMLGSGPMRRPTSLGVAGGYPSTLEQHSQLQPLLHSGERAGAGARFLRDHLFTLPTHSRVGPPDVSRLLGWLGAPVRREIILVPAGA